MRNLVKKRFKWRFLTCLLIGFCLMSCKKDDPTTAAEYDPNKSVEISSFYPQKGHISTPVIVQGSNFGNNPADIEVYFNLKKAAVISVKGDKILVLAPKMPGEICTVSVVVKDQTVVKEDLTFKYTIQTTISTLAGGDRNATTMPTGSISLTDAQFSKNLDRSLCIDADDNLFFPTSADNGNNVYMLNEEADKLKLVANPGVFLNEIIVGYNSIDKNVYQFNSNAGANELKYYDRKSEFASISNGDLSWIGNDVPSGGGMASWGARKTFTMRPSDGWFYFRTSESYAGRFNPVTGIGENLTHGRQFGGNGGDTFGLVFDPRNDNIMYFSVSGQHCIYKYDIAADVVTLFAGRHNSAGYLDGELLTAQFSKPNQMCVGFENEIYVADEENHCIRKISLTTGYVSTVAGTPKEWGYVNGTAKVAKFNRPRGLVINSQGVLYVGDSENRAIRRIAIE